MFRSDKKPDFTAELERLSDDPDVEPTYIVFPAFKGKAIAGTPASFSEGSHGTLGRAQQAAEEELRALMGTVNTGIWEKALKGGQYEKFWSDYKEKTGRRVE